MQQAQAGQLNSNHANLPREVSAGTPLRRLRIVRSPAPSRASAPNHAELVEIALASEQILHANSLATVTTNFIVVRRPQARAETIIGLLRISKVRHIETSHPGLLVIASGVYLLAAAAACSKQGDQAGLPLAVVGTIFVFAYFMTRRAAVAFLVGREATETAHGSLREAAALMKATAKALPRLLGSPQRPK